jgi:hypothetical protein
MFERGGVASWQRGCRMIPARVLLVCYPMHETLLFLDSHARLDLSWQRHLVMCEGSVKPHEALLTAPQKRRLGA